MSADILQTEVTTTAKQEIVRKVYDVPSAGTYYLANPNGGVYVHGFIIATDK